MTERDNVILAMRHQKTLWTSCGFGDIDSVVQSAVAERYEGQTTGVDEFGVRYVYSPQASAVMFDHSRLPLEDISLWREKVVFPDVDAYDWEEAARRDTAGWDRETRFTVVRLFNGPFERLHSLIGFEGALIELMDNPEEICAFVEAFQRYRVKMIENIGRFYKPDAVMIYDDYGTANGMMMSPGIWRECFKPYLKQTIDAAHESGMFFIMHCCGVIEPIFPDIVEDLGPDAIQIQECNDVAALKTRYDDRITFFGGIRTSILEDPNASEEDIREEIRRVITQYGDKSYVAWPTLISERGKSILIDETRRNAAPVRARYGL